jgi:cell wall-associated NlpC family hydrolase
MFCAAIRGDCVCVGRFKARGFDGLLPAQKVWDPSFDSGRAAVDGFIDRVKANPGQQVGWGFDLTPRLISGYSDGKGIPTDYGGIGSLLGKVVWGEGCDDTQHFDCGGFVRYVAKQVTGVPIDRISKNQNLPNLV